MIAPDEILASFADGDYMSVALDGTPDQWQYFAARGLITHPRDAIRSLERFDDPNARFYAAVLSWMAGEDDDACRQLERIAGTHARNMLSLIRKPKIDVLSMLPPVRHGAFVLADGIRHDPKFRVRNLGRLAGDVAIRPDARVAELVDRAHAPDFFVCNMIEWHQIPIDIGSLPCPTIGFTNDFDLHIQGVHRWFRAFDHMAVIDQVVEHPAIRRLSGAPTYAYPMVFGIPSDLPNRPARERDIDIFMSGTMLSAYHPDKARLLHQLLAIENVKMLIVDGHLGVENYWDLLSRSKITPSFCRHPGGIQTRVMEALALGSISLVQPESIMQLWAGEDEGLFVFDEKIGPEPQVRRILANFDAYAAGCRSNAGKLLAAFEPKTIASRFFRFCTFVAARPRGVLDSKRQALLSQKRVMFVHGPRLNSDDSIRLATANSNRLVELAELYPAVEFRNARAREWMLLYADGSYYSDVEMMKPEFLQLAIKYGREAVTVFPDSLVALFNLIRTLFHFGSAEEIEEATKLAVEAVSEPSDRWRIAAADDVYPYDFFAEWFNYRRYLDSAIDDLAGRRTEATTLRTLLLAALHHYLAVVKNSVEHADRARQLDREFPFYALTLGEMLARGENAGDLNRAVDILLDLAGDSMVARRAFQQLRSIEEIRGSRIPAVAALDDRVARVSSTFLQTEHHAYKLFAPYFGFDGLRLGGQHGPVVHKKSEATVRPWLSFVICGQAGLACAQVLDSLARQQGGRDAYEVVYVDCFDKPRQALIDGADTVISLDQRSFLENRSVALREALSHARGDVVAFVEPGTPIDHSLTRRLDDAFYGEAVAHTNGATRPASRQTVVVSAGFGGSGQVRYAAARMSDVTGVCGFSAHEFLLGDGPILQELVERIIRAGAKVQIDGGAGDESALPAWWQSRQLADDAHVIEIGRRVWPLLFDERRIDPAVHLPATLIESVNRNNIVRVYDYYFVLPHSLGPINLEDPADRRRPGIQTARTLAEARALAEGYRLPATLYYVGLRSRLKRWLRSNWPGG